VTLLSQKRRGSSFETHVRMPLKTRHKIGEQGCEKQSTTKTNGAAKNPVFDHRRRPNEGPANRNFESSYPRFPSIIGALIIAAAILLSTLIATVGSRYSAVETSNEEVAWLVDRLTGNVYKCHAEARGKASCEADMATGSIPQPKR
jgi:hypothetical protein